MNPQQTLSSKVIGFLISARLVYALLMSTSKSHHGESRRFVPRGVRSMIVANLQVRISVTSSGQRYQEGKNQPESHSEFLCRTPRLY